VVEVGHGNGLGASSLQIGRARLDDATMLTTVREALTSSRRGVGADLVRASQPGALIGVERGGDETAARRPGGRRNCQYCGSSVL
jgi:hypothetical protein